MNQFELKKNYRFTFGSGEEILKSEAQILCVHSLGGSEIIVLKRVTGEGGDCSSRSIPDDREEDENNEDLERPYKCTEAGCNKRYANKCSLNRHLQGLKLTCRKCHKSYDRKYLYEKHSCTPGKSSKKN